MSAFESVSIIIGAVALILSSGALIFNSIQTRQTNKSLLANQQLERGNAVLHFTTRFFDLVKNGSPEAQLSDPEWSYQFWSLHTSEFYFYHHGILPIFMYTLWMMDLCKFYTGTEGEKVRATHVKYLKTYSFHYKEMADFYNQLYQIAKDSDDEMIRNDRVTKFVGEWFKKNRLAELS
jgi:hypothetical protein